MVGLYLPPQGVKLETGERLINKIITTLPYVLQCMCKQIRQRPEGTMKDFALNTVRPESEIFLSIGD